MNELVILLEVVDPAAGKLYREEVVLSTRRPAELWQLKEAVLRLTRVIGDELRTDRRAASREAAS